MTFCVSCNGPFFWAYAISFSMHFIPWKNTKSFRPSLCCWSSGLQGRKISNWLFLSENIPKASTSKWASNTIHACSCSRSLDVFSWAVPLPVLAVLLVVLVPVDDWTCSAWIGRLTRRCSSATGSIITFSACTSTACRLSNFLRKRKLLKKPVLVVEIDDEFDGEPGE